MPTLIDQSLPFRNDGVPTEGVSEPVDVSAFAVLRCRMTASFDAVYAPALDIDIQTRRADGAWRVIHTLRIRDWGIYRQHDFVVPNDDDVRVFWRGNWGRAIPHYARPGDSQPTFQLTIDATGVPES